MNDSAIKKLKYPSQNSSCFNTEKYSSAISNPLKEENTSLK